jgi:hypothetical protein
MKIQNKNFSSSLGENLTVSACPLQNSVVLWSDSGSASVNLKMGDSPERLSHLFTFPKKSRLLAQN